MTGPAAGGAPATAAGFGARLATAMDAHGPLCVGIDPHAALLQLWGLGDDAAGARELALRVVEAAAGRVGIVKPQVAFFERFGAAGYAVLEEVIGAARAAGLLVIADAKRGDVGSTMAAYAAAWLGEGSPLRADAMTAVAFQGLGSLEAAIAADGGLFVLAATSNPEGRALQASRDEAGRTVSAQLVHEVAQRNADAPGAALADLGVVIGATRPLAQTGIDPRDLARTPILAPGFGAQGARLDELEALFGAAAPAVIPTVSRSVLGAGADGVRAAIAAHGAELRR